MPAEPHPCRTRQDKAVAWTVAHAAELAGVGLPLIGGAVFTGWLDLISVTVAGLWAANEIRLRRTTRTARAAITTPPAHRALPTATGTAEPAEAGHADRKEAKA